jgi:transposase-like protein
MADNNIAEQDHRRIERLVRLKLGFDSLIMAKRPLAGNEAMGMIRRGQVYNVGARDVGADRLLRRGR